MRCDNMDLVTTPPTTVQQEPYRSIARQRHRLAAVTAGDRGCWAFWQPVLVSWMPLRTMLPAASTAVSLVAISVQREPSSSSNCA